MQQVLRRRRRTCCIKKAKYKSKIGMHLAMLADFVYGVRKRWICIFDRWIRTPEINESVTFYSALSGSQSSK